MKNLIIVLLILLNCFTAFHLFNYGLKNSHTTDNLYRLEEDLEKLSVGLNSIALNEMTSSLDEAELGYSLDGMFNTIRFQLMTIRFDEREKLKAIHHNIITNN